MCQNVPNCAKMCEIVRNCAAQIEVPCVQNLPLVGGGYIWIVHTVPMGHCVMYLTDMVFFENMGGGRVSRILVPSDRDATQWKPVFHRPTPASLVPVRMVIEWTLGEISEEGLLAAFPELAPFLREEPKANGHAAEEADAL